MNDYKARFSDPAMLTWIQRQLDQRRLTRSQKRRLQALSGLYNSYTLSGGKRKTRKD